MSNQSKKVVIVIDADLPLGLIANTAAVLALTIGRQVEDIHGPDVYDGSGELHVGITMVPIPILKGTAEKIKPLRESAINEGLFVVDFSDAAQTTTTYDDYTQKIATATACDLQYLGIAMYGNAKPINKLTGSMPLLR